MALILGIETATEVCSVSLFDNNNSILTIDEQKEARHIAALHPAIEKLMAECGKSFAQLDAVAVSSGPGSYTGLRIGVSAAKGICYATDKPLIAVETLLSMAHGIKQHYVGPMENTLFIPMIDARRMDVYTAVFNTEFETIEPVDAISIDTNSFDRFVLNNIVIGGNACAKLRDTVFMHDQIMFLSANVHSAAYLCQPSSEKFNLQQFEDVAYFEPFYLKDFIPGKPRVKGLR